MARLNYGATGGKGISYSRLTEAHRCPRKFQLSEIFGLHLNADNVDFDYGHAVGAGVQELVKNPTDLRRASLAAVAAWNGNIYAEIPKTKKSLWFALRAVERFYNLLKDRETNFLRDYEIAYFTDGDGKVKPAIELVFKINCYDGYVYEGHVDLILKEKKQNKFIVLELKTTGSSLINEASYKNSLQALGYSVVLDKIAKEVGAESAYYVFYLVYKTTQFEFESLTFPKSKLQRAHFINALVIDIEKLEMYRSYNIYPMHGESCYDFFRQCEFFGICTYSDKTLQQMVAERKASSPDRYTELKEEHYDFIFELEDIREQQLEDLSTLKQTLIATDRPQG